MKHYGRSLIQVTILLATFLLTACHDDNEPTSDPTEQTVIFFMPWSTNMTPYFEQNIADFETAIKGGLLKNERVIVCISSTTGRKWARQGRIAGICTFTVPVAARFSGIRRLSCRII